MWYQNIGSMFYSFITNTRVTDRRTDRQNYDSQDRASIAASRGKKGESPLENPVAHNTTSLPRRRDSWNYMLTHYIR